MTSSLSHIIDGLTDAPFDPDRCQWCGDTGFDLKGLAHHLWLPCKVVEKLAQESIEDCRRSNQEFHEAMVRNYGSALQVSSKASDGEGGR